MNPLFKSLNDQINNFNQKFPSELETYEDHTRNKIQGYFTGNSIPKAYPVRNFHHLKPMRKGLIDRLSKLILNRYFQRESC